MTLTGIALAHPVADHAALRGAAADIADRQAAEQRAVPLAENKQRNGLAGVVLLLAANDAGAKGAFGQFVMAPRRLPRLQEATAFSSQPMPLAEIGKAGQAQH